MPKGSAAGATTGGGGAALAEPREFGSAARQLDLPFPEGSSPRAKPLEVRDTVFVPPNAARLGAAEYLGGGANATYIATFPNGARGVYKPVVGEVGVLRGTMVGDMAWREIATKRFGDLLGARVVPNVQHVSLADTQLPRGGRGGPGSLMEFKEGAKTWANIQFSVDAAVFRTPRLRSQMGQMHVLDYAFQGHDRHAGNWMYNANTRRVWMIDNGLGATKGGYGGRGGWKPGQALREVGLEGSRARDLVPRRMRSAIARLAAMPRGQRAQEIRRVMAMGQKGLGGPQAGFYNAAARRIGEIHQAIVRNTKLPTGYDRNDR